MTQARLDLHRRWPWLSYLLLHMLLLGVTAIYLFSFAYLPLQDFPQWIYHGHVFNQLVFHGNDYSGFFSLHPYIPPNASATVLIGVFEVFVQPIVAGKIFLLLCATLIYFGSWNLLVSLTQSKHPVFALIAFSGIFSIFFILGLMNFLFGLGLALLGAAQLYGICRCLPNRIPYHAAIGICVVCNASANGISRCGRHCHCFVG